MSAIFPILIAAAAMFVVGGSYFAFTSTGQPAKSNRGALFWISIGGIFAFLALAQNGWLLSLFYLDTASLSPGTGIRPMALAVELTMTGFLSIILGGVCAFIGFLLCLQRKCWRLSLIAILVGILTWIPLGMGIEGLHDIAELRKLVLEE